MLPPVYTPSRDFTESTGLIAAYAEALTSAHLPRLVVLSSEGAEPDERPQRDHAARVAGARRSQTLPRDAWVPTLEQMGFPRGQTWAFEDVYDGVNAYWIGFGVEGAERVEGTTSARDVFAAAQKTAQGSR